MMKELIDEKKEKVNRESPFGGGGGELSLLNAVVENNAL